MVVDGFVVVIVNFVVGDGVVGFNVVNNDDGVTVVSLCVGVMPVTVGVTVTVACGEVSDELCDVELVVVVVIVEIWLLLVVPVLGGITVEVSKLIAEVGFVLATAATVTLAFTSPSASSS